MNPLIALSIQQPDIAGSYQRGLAAREVQLDQQNRNALREALAQYGGAAMQGDQNALAQLAQFDPQLALGLRSDQQQMELRTREDARQQQELGLREKQVNSGIAFDQERLDMLRLQSRQETEKHAAAMSAAERAAEAAETQRIGQAAAVLYQQGPEAWAAQSKGLFAGIDGDLEALAGAPYEQAPGVIAMLTGVTEGLSGGTADETAEMRNLRFRAEQAGLQSGSPEYQSFMANGGVPRGMSLSVGPDGSVNFSDGPQASGASLLPKPPTGFANVPQPDGTIAQAPIAGGPGEQISGEIAGRIALAEDSLTQLPGLIAEARTGNLTGVLDWMTGVAGRGEQGSARRENKAASEAITRMLTGAGMNGAEASREAELYIVGPFDNAATATDKLEQLQRRLTQLLETAKKGRSGAVTIDPATGMGSVPAAAEPDLDSILNRYR